MKWSAKYAIGVERIDKQHQMLFRMSGDFREALDEGEGEAVYGGLLESLSAYARAHFGFEEECMERCQCPAAQQNKEAHAKFASAVSEFQSRYRASGFDRADARAVVDFIDRWLAEHICRVDIQIRDYAKNL